MSKKFKNFKNQKKETKPRKEVSFNDVVDWVADYTDDEFELVTKFLPELRN